MAVISPTAGGEAAHCYVTAHNHFVFPQLCWQDDHSNLAPHNFQAAAEFRPMIDQLYHDLCQRCEPPKFNKAINNYPQNHLMFLCVNSYCSSSTCGPSQQQCAWQPSLLIALGSRCCVTISQLGLARNKHLPSLSSCHWYLPCIAGCRTSQEPALSTTTSVSVLTSETVLQRTGSGLWEQCRTV